MPDNRIVRVGIEVNNEIRFYERLAITVTGTKFANPNQGECNVTIANLSREVRDFILTETSPFNRNRTRKSIIVEVGRESYGTSVLYRGDIFRSSVSQPPDNVLTLRCLTGQFMKGNVISRSGQAVESVRTIAQSIADDNGLSLQFLDNDKNVSNYSYTGSSLGQVKELSDLTGGDVFIDRDNLVVKSSNAPISGTVRRVSNPGGMIGIPERTEQGVKVSFLYDPQTQLGGQIEIVSTQYPALDGRYVIYKLSYNITNRDIPFYLTAEARRL